MLAMLVSMAIFDSFWFPFLVECSPERKRVPCDSNGEEVASCRPSTSLLEDFVWCRMVSRVSRSPNRALEELKVCRSDVTQGSQSYWICLDVLTACGTLVCVS